MGVRWSRGRRPCEVRGGDCSEALTSRGHLEPPEVARKDPPAERLEGAQLWGRLDVTLLASRTTRE